MKPLALSLVALALGVAALLVFRGALRPDPEPFRSDTIAAPRLENDGEPTAAPTGQEADPLASTAPRSVVAGTSKPSPETRRYGSFPGGQRWVRGRVELVAGLPADPTLRILALRRPHDAQELYGRDGLVQRLGDRASEDRGDLDGALYALSPVAADGSFALPIARAAERTWLVLDGRFLFSRPPLGLAFASEEGDREDVRLAPALGAYVHGEIVLPDDVRALPKDVEVELGPDTTTFALVPGGADGLFARRTSVDHDGRFAFRAVDTERPYEVVARSTTLADALLDGLLFAPGEEHALRCVLGHGATLRGTVVDAGGAPVGGARVTARQSAMWGFPGKVLAGATSKPDGAFTLSGVPEGKRLVIASKSGFLESAASSVVLADREERGELRLALEDGATVTGVVRFEDDRPAADVEVTVGFDPEALMGMNAFNAARGASGRARTDAEGRFRVGDLGRGPFLVEASVEREADGASLRYAAREQPVKANSELELVLRRPPLVTGRVVNGEGDPVTDFEVFANSQGAAFWAAGSAQRQSVHDEEGRFVLDTLHEGTWTLEVRAIGYGRSAAVEVRLPAEDDGELLVTLAPPAVAKGVVLDPSGRPKPGARVTLAVDNARSFAKVLGRLQLPEAHTDEEGAFELRGLSAGSQALMASHPDHASSDPVAIELEAGGAADEVNLRLRAGGTIVGEAYDKQGEPLGAAQVIYQNTSTWFAVTDRTSADGSFRKERLDPGQWSVTVMNQAPAGSEPTGGADAAGFLENMTFAMVDVRDGGEHRVTLGGRPEDPVRVYGRVLHGDDPVPSALVSFFPDGAKGFDAMTFTQTDADGRYSVELGQTGAYLVQVQNFAEGGSTQQNNVEYTERVPDGDEHELDLALPLGAIRGVVLDAGGDPVGGTRVTLSTDGGVVYGTFLGGQYAETVTDKSGRYEFLYVRPGTYGVAAGGALWGGVFGNDTKSGRVVRDGLRVREGESLDDVDFRLREPGEIGGVVVDATGQAVGGASIFVYDENGRALERFSMTTTSTDGRFRYVGLNPGRYQVSARTTDACSADAGFVTVGEGGAAQTRLTLGGGSVLFVRVTDKSGTDVRSSVLVVDEAGRQVNGMLAYSELASGLSEGFSTSEQRVGPLPPGRYRVTATAADGRSTSKTVELSGQPTRKLRLRLK